MKTKKAIKLLQNKKPTAQVYWNELDGQYGLVQIENREEENKVVLSNLSNVNRNCDDYKPIISVETLLTCLKKLPDDADKRKLSCSCYAEPWCNCRSVAGFFDGELR